MMEGRKRGAMKGYKKGREGWSKGKWKCGSK